MSDGSASVFPLTLAQEGERVRVVRLDRGERAGRRLSEIGLVQGTEAVLVKCDAHGPMMVAVGDTRLAIGRSVAGRVLVELV